MPRTYDELSDDFNRGLDEVCDERKARRYRIRKCEGDTAAWCLIRLRDDGTEIDSYGGYTTGLSLDHLLKNAGHLTPQPGDIVELIPG